MYQLLISAVVYTKTNVTVLSINCIIKRNKIHKKITATDETIEQYINRIIA